MHKFDKVIISCILLICFIFGLSVYNFNDVMAGEDNRNTTTYEAVIDDEADLFSDTEENSLLEIMESIKTYGNVAVVTIDYNEYGSTETWIENYYYGHYGSSSGTVFLIDMDERNIWIFSNGEIYDIITKAYADTITDNVYKYASDSEYYECALKALIQIKTLLSGGKISSVMKYISNILIAIGVALILNFVYIINKSKAKKASDNVLLDAIHYNYTVHNPRKIFTGETKTYSPQSSSDSSSGGSSSSGGGGGGGGHSF